MQSLIPVDLNKHMITHVHWGPFLLTLFLYRFLSYSLSISLLPSLLTELFQIPISISNFSDNQHQYIFPSQCLFSLILYFMLYSLAPMKGVPFLVRQYQGLWICLCDRSQDKVNKTETIKMKITTDCAWLSHSICCLQSPHREKPRLCWFQQIS